MEEKAFLVGYFEENILVLGKKGTCISPFMSLLTCMLWKIMKIGKQMCLSNEPQLHFL